MAVLIQTWQTPVDSGGGNPERTYFGPSIGAGYTHLSVSCQVNNVFWPGSLVVDPGETTALGGANFGYWFNSVHAGGSQFTASDPNQAYVTSAADRLRITTNAVPAGMSTLIELFGDAALPPAYCAYGTRVRGGVDLSLYITPELLSIWLAERNMGWLLAALTAAYYANLNVQELCSQPQPDLPAIDLSTPEATSATAMAIVRSIAWPSLCECTPGTPAPVPFPPPTATQPPGWPTAPAFNCAEADLCATLIALRKDIAAIAQSVGVDLGLTTLIQRYHVPFAWVPGARHSSLSGEHSFGVSRLVGIKVDVESVEGEHELRLGNPPYIWDLGWMSIMTGDGMIQEKRISQAHFVWQPQLMQEATIFGFSLTPGTVASFTELQAET